MEAINGKLEINVQLFCVTIFFIILKKYSYINEALKKIGWMNTALQELLMWAVHHEEEPSVRIAACEALGTSDAKGPKLQHFLQERYALEPNAEVQRCVLIGHYHYLE